MTPYTGWVTITESPTADFSYRDRPYCAYDSLPSTRSPPASLVSATIFSPSPPPRLLVSSTPPFDNEVVNSRFSDRPLV